MAGWYSLRQASANANQSVLYPKGSRLDWAWAAIEVRQSTRVPNTSKIKARMAMLQAFSTVAMALQTWSMFWLLSAATHMRPVSVP